MDAITALVLGLSCTIFTVSALPLSPLMRQTTPLPPSAFAKWAPTDSSNRAACPFTNSLANHNFLPKTGITRDDIHSALSSVLMMEDDAILIFQNNAEGLGTVGPDGIKRVDIGQLNAHNHVEHDASLTRDDVALGDPIGINRTLYEAMKSMSADGAHLTARELIDFRAQREQDSISRNPEFKFGPKEQFTAYGEAALLLMAMSEDSTVDPLDANASGMRLDWLDMLFLQEKFPTELGWTPRPIYFVKTLNLAARMRVLTAQKLLANKIGKSL